METLPFFSIIIPVYQSKNFLIRCVTKIQEQTFKNIEIILVDDGSTDGSSAECDRLAGKDRRIVVVHKNNGGVSSARNAGIRISKGKWIIFVDSDDIVSKVMCENFFNYIKKYNSYDFVACNFAENKQKLIKNRSTDNIILDLKNNLQNINLVNQMLLSDYNNSSEAFRSTFGNNVVLNSPCAKAYNKNFLKIKKIVFQEEIKYAEDLIFNIEVLVNGAKGLYINDAIYFYNPNFNSSTKKSYVPNIIENYFLFKKIVKKIIIDKNLRQLQTGLDAYCVRSALWVFPADVFSENNTIKKCKERFATVINSEEFSQLINWEILSRTKNVFNKNVIRKCKLVLKKRFLILFVWYKILKK